MIQELDARFGIPDVVRFEAGPGGLVRAVVTTVVVVGHRPVLRVDRGIHVLKGVPGEWRLFAAAL
jgi:hypothetical protein